MCFTSTQSCCNLKVTSLEMRVHYISMNLKSLESKISGNCRASCRKSWSIQWQLRWFHCLIHQSFSGATLIWCSLLFFHLMSSTYNCTNHSQLHSELAPMVSSFFLQGNILDRVLISDQFFKTYLQSPFRHIYKSEFTMLDKQIMLCPQFSGLKQRP